MSGSIVKEHRKLFYRQFGDRAVSRALCKIDPSVREEFEQALAGTWIRVSTMETVYAAMAREVGRDVVDLHTDIGRRGIEQTLKSVWRLLLRMTSDSALITRSPIIFAKSFDRGKIVARIPKPGSGEIVVTEFPGLGEFSVRSLKNGIGTVLTLAGREDVRVRVVERTEEGAILEATWRI